ncbi:MAG: branched-chain amino acid aminotransferase [Oscillospiraceae bacterium]|nr:branched-chain amino acid aminotransferase [Oscillospiraceae bacterium]
MLNINITRTTTPKQKPNNPLIGIGKAFTDHMFLMKYSPDQGWHDPKIEPFHDLTLSPATTVFHYGQEMFEGMKAYRGKDDDIYLFRPEKNGERTNMTNKRLCMPEIPVEDFVQAVRTLVELDADWIPGEPGTSLYIRPFIIGTDPFIGLTPSETFLFCIIMAPSGPYYGKDEQAPVSIWVEEEYVRAVRGGMGFAKAGGNYAASMVAQANAKQAGYAQVLWLDGLERKYVEEVGAMNIFFKIGGKVVTPALTGSILPGITRDSVITLCRSWGLSVEERLVSIDELVDANRQGLLEEVFGTGTAAVISPVGKLGYREDVLVINDNKTGPLSQRIYETVTGIQCGALVDPYGWRVKI